MYGCLRREGGRGGGGAVTYVVMLEVEIFRYVLIKGSEGRGEEVDGVAIQGF